MKKVSIPLMRFAVVSLFCCLLSVGCQKNVPITNAANIPGKSSVNIFLTDDQSLVFENVFLNIIKVEVKAEDSLERKHEEENENENDDNDHHGSISGGWMAVDIHPGVYDILKFRNGLDTLFAAGSFSSDKNIKKLRLTLGSNNSVVLNGVTIPLTIKDNDNFVVIKLDENMVQLNNGGLTNLWIDIDAGRSVRQHGNRFELKTSAKIFSKEKAGALEGRVFPKDAKAIIMAINGSDTTSAKPEDEGEFKFIGLKPGTYSLLYHATVNNYKDTTIRNIKVSGKEDAHVVNVTLHK